MNKLLILQNNEPYITSLTVADQLNRTHKSITNLCKDYSESFKKFGTFGSSNSKSTGGRPEIFYYFNEQQLTFLMMMLRVKKNEFDKVLEFKESITKEFFKMRSFILSREINYKNEVWLESREKGKITRKETTAIYKEYLEYAIKSGSEGYKNKPKNVYSNFTKLLNKTLFEINFTPKKGTTIRDFMDVNQLITIQSAELAAQKIIHREIDKGSDYKEIYKIVSKDMKKYAEIIGVDAIPGIKTKLL